MSVRIPKNERSDGEPGRDGRDQDWERAEVREKTVTHQTQGLTGSLRVRRTMYPMRNHQFSIIAICSREESASRRRERMEKKTHEGTVVDGFTEERQGDQGDDGDYRVRYAEQVSVKCAEPETFLQVEKRKRVKLVQDWEERRMRTIESWK
jgi:hypothetical protein